MKKHLLIVTSLILGGAFAQDLPKDPEPGKCYVRCVTPDVYKNEEVKVMVKPEYKTIKTYPAEYKTVEESVLVKEAFTKLEIVPATFEYETKSYVAKEKSNALKAHKPTFKSDSEVIETLAAISKWEKGEKIPDCTSADPNDCRIWCYKPYPAEFEEVPTSVLDNAAHTTSTPVEEVPGSYKVKVVKTPVTTKETTIPAEYKTIKKTVLVKDAWTEESVHEAIYETVTKEVLVTKGGLTSWEEVDCKLTEYNLLPINYDLNSAVLLPQSKKIIDKLLYPVLASNTKVSVEIASHTDSRGDNESNQSLSERRAKSVVDYLVDRGINPSRLVSNGYGETQLKNRCENGVSCTEREHRANRRTEFRIISK